MRTGLEFAGFASVSLVAHLAVFAATAPDGMASGGEGGAEAVTIAAPIVGADAELAALVRQWDAPVQMVEPDAPPAAPAAPEPAPELATPRIDAPGLPSSAALNAPSAEPAPQIVAEVPQLFTMPTTRETPRPPPRPEPRQAAPAPRASQQAAPRAARAAGQGAQAQRGEGRAAQSSGTAPSASQMAQWGGAIRAAIQRRQSRPTTRARGTVHLRLQVSAEGRLVSVNVAQGSGNAALDQAALRAVQGASLPRAPAGISGTHHFNLPLNYQ